MTKEVQLRRGTTTQMFAFTGQVGELTPDTTKNCLVLHDGATAGGKAIDAPRGWIDGFTLSNNSALPNSDIDIAPGQARDSTNVTIFASAATIVKKANTAWAVGSGNGGLFNTGYIGAAARYHAFLIEKDTDGSLDAGFDINATATKRPAGYTRYRRIGSIQTDATGNVIAFLQYGDTFLWATVPDLDILDSSLTTTRKTYSLKNVPSGVKVAALLTIRTPSSIAICLPPEAADQAPSFIATPLFTAGIVVVWTDTSGRITARADSPGTLYVAVTGWIDPRGRSI